MWLNKWRGQLILECSGTRVINIINEATAEGIELTDLHLIDDNNIKLTILLRDFFVFVKMARKNKLKIKITQKNGLPFFIRKIMKKKFMMFGGVVTSIALFALTTFIWQVDIMGTDKVPVSQIQNILDKSGMTVGKVKFWLPDKNTVKRQIIEKIPQISWVGINVEGSHLVVTVVEKRAKQKAKSDFKEHGPVNLIASKSALIYDLKVDRGNPLVEVNDTVEKGQVLVSGKYGDIEKPEQNTIVGAKGKVIGHIWYEAEVKVPLNYEKKFLTGNTEDSLSLYIAGKLFKNPFNSPKFSKYETTTKIKKLFIGSWELPVGFAYEKCMEMRVEKKRLSIEEAVSLGIKYAEEKLASQLGKDGKVLNKNILFKNRINDVIYVRIKLDCLENIAVPQPILSSK